MRSSSQLLPLALAFVCLAVPPAIRAGQVSPAAVSFDPRYEPAFKKAYGAREVGVLRSEIEDSLSHSLKSAGGRCRLALAVRVRRAAPTHPTMQQQMDNPSLDPFRTVYRDGGASLAGQVLDASGRVLETVRYEYFTGGLPPLSPARDPWGDARIAIDGLSKRLVQACIRQSASAQH